MRTNIDVSRFRYLFLFCLIAIPVAAISDTENLAPAEKDAKLVRTVLMEYLSRHDFAHAGIDVVFLAKRRESQFKDQGPLWHYESVPELWIKELASFSIPVQDVSNAVLDKSHQIRHKTTGQKGILFSMYFMTWANNGAPLGFGSECYYSPWKEPLIAYQFDGQSNSWKITGHSELNVTDFHPVSQGAIRWLLKGDVPPKDQIGPWPQRQAERLAEHAKSILRTRETVLSWKRKKLPVDLIIGAYTRFRYLYDLERDTLEEPLFDPQTVPKDCLCVYPSGKNKDGIYNLVWVACSWCSPLYVINLHDMPDGSVEAIALLGISHID